MSGTLRRKDTGGRARSRCVRGPDRGRAGRSRLAVVPRAAFVPPGDQGFRPALPGRFTAGRGRLPRGWRDGVPRSTGRGGSDRLDPGRLPHLPRARRGGRAALGVPGSTAQARRSRRPGRPRPGAAAGQPRPSRGTAGTHEPGTLARARPVRRTARPRRKSTPASFAEWMSSALRREGMTQEAAARQLGVSVKTGQPLGRRRHPAPDARSQADPGRVRRGAPALKQPCTKTASELKIGSAESPPPRPFPSVTCPFFSYFLAVAAVSPITGRPPQMCPTVLS